MSINGNGGMLTDIVHMDEGEADKSTPKGMLSTSPKHDNAKNTTLKVSNDDSKLVAVNMDIADKGSEKSKKMKKKSSGKPGDPVHTLGKSEEADKLIPPGTSLIASTTIYNPNSKPILHNDLIGPQPSVEETLPPSGKRQRSELSDVDNPESDHDTDRSEVMQVDDGEEPELSLVAALEQIKINKANRAENKGRIPVGSNESDEDDDEEDDDESDDEEEEPSNLEVELSKALGVVSVPVGTDLLRLKLQVDGQDRSQVSGLSKALQFEDLDTYERLRCVIKKHVMEAMPVNVILVSPTTGSTNNTQGHGLYQLLDQVEMHKEMVPKHLVIERGAEQWSQGQRQREERVRRISKSLGIIVAANRAIDRVKEPLFKLESDAWGSPFSLFRSTKDIGTQLVLFVQIDGSYRMAHASAGVIASGKRAISMISKLPLTQLSEAFRGVVAVYKPLTRLYTLSELDRDAGDGQYKLVTLLERITVETVGTAATLLVDLITNAIVQRAASYQHLHCKVFVQEQIKIVQASETPRYRTNRITVGGVPDQLAARTAEALEDIRSAVGKLGLSIDEATLAGWKKAAISSDTTTSSGTSTALIPLLEEVPFFFSSPKKGSSRLRIKGERGNAGQTTTTTYHIACAPTGVSPSDLGPIVAYVRVPLSGYHAGEDGRLVFESDTRICSTLVANYFGKVLMTDVTTTLVPRSVPFPDSTSMGKEVIMAVRVDRKDSAQELQGDLWPEGQQSCIVAYGGVRFEAAVGIANFSQPFPTIYLNGRHVIQYLHAPNIMLQTTNRKLTVQSLVEIGLAEMGVSMVKSVHQGQLAEPEQDTTCVTIINWIIMVSEEVTQGDVDKYVDRINGQTKVATTAGTLNASLPGMLSDPLWRARQMACDRAKEERHTSSTSRVGPTRDTLSTTKSRSYADVASATPLGSGVKQEAYTSASRAREEERLRQESLDNRRALGGRKPPR